MDKPKCLPDSGKIWYKQKTTQMWSGVSVPGTTIFEDRNAEAEIRG